ncbi:hypothetical protein H6P81_000777 [Aristolochia fimbriata]|uniref:Uncharacterized protein n=1 Tax=Aristolochia fimbriata TaxID=158543 RepID=A0AAV7F5V0_ARIFI|nr:hypothetical protein H6P81_000777 [Aristolochia fimbriata]
MSPGARVRVYAPRFSGQTWTRAHFPSLVPPPPNGPPPPSTPQKPKRIYSLLSSATPVPTSDPSPVSILPSPPGGPSFPQSKYRNVATSPTTLPSLPPNNYEVKPLCHYEGQLVADAKMRGSLLAFLRPRKYSSKNTYLLLDENALLGTKAGGTGPRHINELSHPTLPLGHGHTDTPTSV